MKKNGIDYYTVRELKDVLDKLVSEGYGDRIVLFPDFDLDYGYDYRTVNGIDTDDMSEKCIYLKCPSDKEEAMLWEEDC